MTTSSRRGLLGIGLPLAIVFGWAVALVVLGDLEIWEAAVLGAMLEPTDAALGKAVVSNPRVPLRIRQALNVESGLNDGIRLPLFIVFLEAAQAAESSLSVADAVTELVAQVGIAVAVGVVVGVVGAHAIRWGRTSGSASSYWLQVGLLSLAIAAYSRRDAARWLRLHRRLGRGRDGRTNRAADDVDESSCRCSPRPRATC